MSDPILSQSILNRTLLRRQMLVQRSGSGIESVLEGMGGLQNQYAPSGYVGLWSRLTDFSRRDLTAAIEERRVVQGTLMRATIHLVSAADYPLLAAGVRRARRDWWLRVQGRALRGVDMEAAADFVRQMLAQGPRRQSELLALLDEAGFPRVAWNGCGLFVDLIRVPPSGTWERRRADVYALAEAWLGSSKATEDEGLSHIVRRYLGAFGPAPLADIAAWAGVPAQWLGPAVDRLDLVRYRDEQGRQLLDMAGLEPDAADLPAPPRFLGTWDAMLLVHARRTGVMPEEYRPVIFSTRAPQSFPTFLVGGRVAGTWRHVDGRISLQPLGKLARADRLSLEREAVGLAGLYAP